MAAKKDMSSALGSLIGNSENPRSGNTSRRPSEVSLFGRSDNQIHYIDPNVIGPYSIPSDIPGGGQPFSMEVTDEYLEIKESIQEFGVKEPAIVRSWKYDSNYKYEMIAGHRRQQICKELGIKLPCIIANSNDEEASVVMSITNTLGRKKPRPSELAWSYRIELDARRKLNKLPKETETTPPSDSPEHEVCHDGTRAAGRATEEIGKRRNQSARTVSRYIRLTELHPDILYQYIDPGYMDIVTGEHISFLTMQQQELLLSRLQSGYIPNVKQAELIKELAKSDQFNENSLNNILGKKNPEKKPVTFKIPGDRIGAFFPKKVKPIQMEQEIYGWLNFKQEYFPEATSEDAQAEIRAAMEMYRANKKNE